MQEDGEKGASHMHGTQIMLVRSEPHACVVMATHNGWLTHPCPVLMCTGPIKLKIVPLNALYRSPEKANASSTQVFAHAEMWLG